ADEQASISALRATVKRLVARTSVEQWAINPSVHFNAWENLQPQEFQPVADAFHELLDTLRCENGECGSYVYVFPRKGEAEGLRCNCGAKTINLKMP
ncbi:MAG: chromosome segregation protein SMC, partial [Pseudomonadota bacterium]